MRAWASRSVSVSAALGAVVIACSAQGQAGFEVADAADPGFDAGADARVAARTRDGSGSVTDAESAAPADAAIVCTGKVVINELMPDSPSGAEFVELYNPNDCAVSLGGWKLSYRAASDNPGLPLRNFAVGDGIPARSFLVFANAKFTGQKSGDLIVGAAMSKTGGQLGLLNADATLVDAVGYGATTGGTFTEKAAAPAPPSGGSLGRKSDGDDSDDNAADFTAFAQHSAGTNN